MTKTCAFFSRGLLAALLPAAAFAAPPPAAPPAPRPAPRVIVVQPNPSVQFQQTVRQQQVQSQLQQNQLQEQLRQQNAANIRRPFANNQAAAAQLDGADAAANNAYNARQQALIDRYNSQAALPPPSPVLIRKVPAAPAPAQPAPGH